MSTGNVVDLDLHRPMEELPKPDHYRVVSKPGSACPHCYRGEMWTVISGQGEEELGIGMSWGDLEVAKSIRDLLNMAYEAGLESKP